MSPYEELMNDIKLNESKKDELKNLYREKKKKENRKIMRKSTFIKPIAAVAACMVMVLTAGVVGEKVISSNASNAFSVTVNAAELNENNFVTIASSEKSSGYALSETTDGEVAYSLEMPIACEGQNVKSVTYSINEGAFQIVSSKTNDVITSGKKVSDEMNVPINEKNNGDMINYYNEFSVNYDNQKTEDMKINVCGIKNIQNLKNAFNLNNKCTNEEIKAAWDELYGNVAIKCTVEFKDGSTQEQTIAISNKIMTENEANYVGEKTKSAEENVYITFGLQE